MDETIFLCKEHFFCINADPQLENETAVFLKLTEEELESASARSISNHRQSHQKHHSNWSYNSRRMREREWTEREMNSAIVLSVLFTLSWTLILHFYDTWELQKFHQRQEEKQIETQSLKEITMLPEFSAPSISPALPTADSMRPAMHALENQSSNTKKTGRKTHTYYSSFRRPPGNGEEHKNKKTEFPLSNPEAFKRFNNREVSSASSSDSSASGKEEKQPKKGADTPKTRTPRGTQGQKKEDAVLYRIAAKLPEDRLACIPEVLGLGVSINENEVVAMLDTGARINLMPIKMAKQLGLMHTFTRQEMTVNGIGEKKSPGYVETSIRLGDDFIDTKINLLPGNIPILFGLNFMRDVNLSVDITEQVAFRTDRNGTRNKFQLYNKKVLLTKPQ